LGDEVFALTLTWIAVGIAGPSASLIPALQSAALLATAVFGGLLVDRRDPARTLRAAALLRATNAAALVGVLWVAGPSLPVLAAAAVVMSATRAFTEPSVQMVLPRLAEGREMIRASTALFDSTLRFARVTAPLLVGAAQALSAPMWLLAAAVAGQLGLAAAARAGVRGGLFPRRGGRTVGDRLHLREGGVHGRHVVADDHRVLVVPVGVVAGKGDRPRQPLVGEGERPHIAPQDPPRLRRDHRFGKVRPGHVTSP
jgi:hypothetical protein